MKVKSDKIKIKDLLDLKRAEMLTVNPEYQRGAVWSESQQKKLIDSVLRGYPLPLIYLHYKKTNFAGLQREHLEIIDGQQRINALYKFGEGALKLFHPINDDKKARFPNFVKNAPCQWANCDFHSLDEDLKTQFYETELFIVKVVTDIEDEARDIFIRLQSGLPLNAQEKRDAWPGGYTDFVLRFGGKKEITRYPGHNFFKKKSNQDRGDMRQLCAQIGMMFFEEVVKGNWLDIGTQQVDDYYYQNLDFDINSPKVTRFSKVLDLIVEIFAGYKGKKLLGHEAIHIVLLVNSLIDDYTRSWQDNFIAAFDKFREMDAKARKLKQGDFWQHYGSLTQTQSGQARTIQTRHNFFTYVMFDIMKPVCKDNVRSYGQLEREIIYYRDRKQCAVCGIEIKWDELEIHHLQEHQSGGQTTLENGVSVHYDCHPKGQDAINFYYAWKLKHEKNVS